MMAAPFTRYGDAVERYVDLGYLPIPIRPNEKRPAVSDWTNLSPARAISLALQHREAGIGVLTGSLAAIDVDVRNSNVATDLLAYIRRMIIQTAPELVRYGNPPKFLVLCQAEKADPKRTSPLYRDSAGVEHRIECMGIGQQVVLAGIHPDTNEPYFWAKGDPLDQDVAVYELPVLTEEQWQALVDYFCKLAEAQGWERVADSRSAVQQGELEAPFAVAGLTLDIAREALSYIPNDDLPYDEWLDVGMALHQQGAGAADWFQVWDEWSATSQKYTGSQSNWKRWETFNADRPGGITMRSLLWDAEQNGWTRPDSVEGARVEQEEFPDMDEENPEGGAMPTVNIKGVEVPIFESSTPQDWGEYVPPPLEWAWQNYIPVGDVTLLYARGGTGKTTIISQLASAIAAGEERFMGSEVRNGKVLLFLCEDDKDDVIRRQDTLQRNGGPTRQVLGDRLVVLPRKGEDNVLLRFDRNGKAERTATWWKLHATCTHHNHGGVLDMLVIDGKADVFGGNENDTVQTRQFVQRALVDLAMQHQCAVVLIAHPSRGGESSGQGDGANMQWDATVKSRLYLKHELDREGAPTGVTILSHKKSNRAALQGDIKMRMVDGSFVEIAPEEVVENPQLQECIQDLLTIMAAEDLKKEPAVFKESSRSDSPFWQYAAIQQHAKGKTTWSQTQWQTAMAALEQAGRVERYVYRNDRPNSTAFRLTKAGRRRAVDEELEDEANGWTT